jgi:molybdopterin-binding protein
MGLSASNRITGTIKSLNLTTNSADITLETASGELESVITRTSADRLGLREGQTVTAVIKATDVMISTEE